MGSGVFDANGILRVGPDIEGASFWQVTGTIDDTDDPFNAEVADFIVVGDLAGDLTINLPDGNPNTPASPGEMIAVKLMGDPDGNTVTVDGGDFQIDGAVDIAMTVQYQQVFLVWVSDAYGWAILESGEGIQEVFSVFQAVGNVLPNAFVSNGDDLDVGVGDFAGTNLTANGTLTAVGVSTQAQIISTLAAAPADGTIAASQVTFWLDATNGATVFHIKAKQANGTVVGAAIPLA